MKRKLFCAKLDQVMKMKKEFIELWGKDQLKEDHDLVKKNLKK